MPVIAFFLAFLFLWPQPHEPKCPPLQKETGPIWKELKNPDVEVTNVKVVHRGFEFSMGTTTFKNGKAYVQVGTGIDKEAVAHNKRVEECRTINGEF